MNFQMTISAAAVAALVASTHAEAAMVTHWSLFNIEEESDLGAQYVTYATLGDMLRDTNRLGVFNPDGSGIAHNIVGSGSDGTTFWSLFNIEEENDLGAQYATYAALSDMVGDTNRLGVFNPEGSGIARNIVGSGSDGTTFWSLFNIEEENDLGAQYATYATLGDMLGDTNRLGVFNPDGNAIARNIVGSGSDGTIFWSLFNIEEESNLGAQYATYATLGDMLGDTNRLGVFNPDGNGIARNIVGSGATPRRDLAPIPLPAAGLLLVAALGGLVLARRR